MTRRTILLVLLLLPLAALSGHTAPQDACVRIVLPGRPEVSGSGTVVYTTPGRSLVLTCAHLWMVRGTGPARPLDPALVRRRIAVDVPRRSDQVGVTVHRRPNRLVYLCRHRDLALVEVAAGPLPHVCRVAPDGLVPGTCLSCGYDEGKPTMVAERTHVSRSTAAQTYTRESPVEGRSGGPLIDERTGQLVGVCRACRVRQWQDAWGGRHEERSGGAYVSLTEVRAFLRYWNTYQGGQRGPRATPASSVLPGARPPPVVRPTAPLCPT